MNTPKNFSSPGNTKISTAPGLYDGPFRAKRPFSACAVALFTSIALLTGNAAQAANYYWDVDGDSTAGTGGTGDWDVSSSFWRTPNTAGALVTWPAATGHTAQLGGTAGTLTIGSGVTITASGITFLASGYLIQAAGTGALSVGGAGTGTLTLTTAGASHVSTINAPILAGNLSKTGLGTVVLSGSNTYSRKTNIINGALSVASLNSVSGGSASSNLGAPDSVDNGTINFGQSSTTGTLIYTGAGETTDRVINLASNGSGGGIIQADGSGALVFSSNFTATGFAATGNTVKLLTLSGFSTAENEIQGAIVDHDANNITALTKSGAGTWKLSGSSTYTGETKINEGLLIVTSLKNTGTASSLGASGQISLGLLSTTGTLKYTGGGDTTDRAVKLGGSLGGGAIDSSGSGALIFTGDFTANGTNKTLTLQGSNTDDNEISGNIIQPVATTITVTKEGSGKWILSGSNTYTGATLVKAGTLLINGSASSVVTVGDAANLTAMAVFGGSGSVGNVTVGAAAGNTGATLSPGYGAGAGSGVTLKTANLTFAADSGAHLAMRIGRTTGGISTSGDASDHVDVTGGVTLDGDLTLSLLTGTGYSIAENDVLYLIINDGDDAVTGQFASLNGVATDLGNGQTFTFDSYIWEITYTADFENGMFTGGNDVALMAVTAIPESSTWALLMAGLGLMLISSGKIRVGKFRASADVKG